MWNVGGLTLRGFACTALLGVLLLAGCSNNNDAERPNILFILTDDLGNNDISSWGDDSAPTPSLDEFSRQSVRFRRHYTDSTCSPSRAALLTGRHPVSIGFQADGLGLSSDLETLPESLRTLGYRTAHVGKWHVGEALEYPEIQPGHHGFDYWFGMLNHFILRGPGENGEILQRQPTHVDPWLQENGAPPRQYQGYLDDLLIDKAIELMDAGEGQPWFINLWLYSPHTPYQPSPTFAQQFPDTPEGRFQAVLKQLDHNVQRLLKALEERGLAENTIVVFASDNGGPNIARDNNFPLLGKKATYTEGGVRSPLWLIWPHHYENADIVAPTHITDLYPTLLTLTGGAAPEGIMGRSLRPLLEGSSLPEPRGYYWMSDSGRLGMAYGGHLFDRASIFYRDVLGGFKDGRMTAAIGAPQPSGNVPDSLDQPQANALMKKEERKLREPSFNWQPAGNGQPAMLTGRDFQRAPVFGGFSMGFALGKPAKTPQVQTLLEQEGIWRLDLLADGRLLVAHGHVEQISEPLQAAHSACNSLVVSVHVKPASTFPFPGPASSRLALYWNGHVLLDSERVLQRPGSGQGLANPTYIGSGVDGARPYLGEVLGKPIVINKLLLPEQEGYGLPDLIAELCPGV
ncbi:MULTISPECIES: sulfatase-like hydrolase/transferase [unclassified Pseudomonas]|uniref:sulfatase-like hydrolase/transferase n=1 Tax=unclassified Pseudomonas TaxID=196821 RepID=UPI00244A40AE|nr:MULTISPECIES: sulfatase-like hydrolase/transferase [unclassified Pseudomonas]MDG9929175.1 sulfatase-like hydrolase/transferase [Pseudomonas sp. GD04042]MDH0484043.1 sulfatase-like hydrolase/transferase [Pseudomonas sp. GD04015]MDH0605851.1 sulfatase-like hydrolase/transferase [Pseudomonas sp. GD03869]